MFIITDLYVTFKVLFVGDGVESRSRVSLDNISNWKQIWQREGEINNTKACMTNDEASFRILNGYYNTRVPVIHTLL
jgi:hypothetical protein